MNEKEKRERGMEINRYKESKWKKRQKNKNNSDQLLSENITHEADESEENATVHCDYRRGESGL